MNGLLQFVTAEELTVGPEPKKRVCPFCIEPETKIAQMERRPIKYERGMRTLSDGWICSGCDRKVVVHRQPETCEKCGRSAWAVYFGNRRKLSCDCGLSQEERDAIALAEVEFYRQEAINQRKAAEAALVQMRERKELELRQRKADRCWEDKGRKCSVKAKKPTHSFCGDCVHLSPRDYSPPPSPFEEQMKFTQPEEAP